MNEEAVIKNINMKPIYLRDEIEWHITIEYLDGHEETADVMSFLIGGRCGNAGCIGKIRNKSE